MTIVLTLAYCMNSQNYSPLACIFQELGACQLEHPFSLIVYNIGLENLYQKFIKIWLYSYRRQRNKSSKDGKTITFVCRWATARNKCPVGIDHCKEHSQQHIGFHFWNVLFQFRDKFKLTFGWNCSGIYINFVSWYVWPLIHVRFEMFKTNSQEFDNNNTFFIK